MPHPAVALSPYSAETQRVALASLLEGAPDPAGDARHIFGHGDPHHELSMLQVITATRILDYQRQEEEAVAPPPLEELLQAAEAFARRHGPRLNLQRLIQSQAPRMALAAEFKRASPSKGAIASDEHLRAGDQAVRYARAGADVVSVLTEARWFRGALADLTEVRTTTNDMPGRRTTRPAVLRKDFVVSRRMVAEAAAAGADSVLLIVAVLPQHLLADLIAYSRSLDMEPLVEVHAEVELEVALAAGARVIGVNNRNLHTFQLDLQTSERVAARLEALGLRFHHNDAVPSTADGSEPPSVPPEYTLCALSGMSTCDDVDRYRRVGLGMCLIGESLMRAADPEAAIAALCLDPRDFAARSATAPSPDGTASTVAITSGSGGAYTRGTQLVKVCGVTTPEDALAACRAGANLIGVIFAKKSPRRVSPDQAAAVVAAVRGFGERDQRLDWSRLPSSSGAPSAVAHLTRCADALADATRQRPAVVGVFQNQTPDEVRETVAACGLDLVQLHGQEGMAAANASECGAPALRVVDICVDPATGLSSADAVDTVLQALTADPVAILLDTSLKHQASGGGTGRAFDWAIAERLQARGLPVLVAGGLTADTVADCVSRIRPFGVDVSSGVEAAPGRKDHEKVAAFVQRARKAAVEASQGF